jgi:DNA polymerase-3 subunit alpha
MDKDHAGFVHLHVHTEYSLQEATCRLEELIQKAKSWGMTSLAITDKGAVHGAVRFYEWAETFGIHPIIGCETEIGVPGESLILLAATYRGYERIVEWLNTRAHFNGISSGDVIALSGGRNGIIHRLLAKGETDLAEKKALEYVEVFGKENFYLEVQHHSPDDLPMIAQTAELSGKTGIPLVATHDVHYIHPEDERILHLLQGKRGDSTPAAGSFYLPSPDEMKEKFRHLPDALANTVRIANRCHVKFEPGKAKLPKFSIPELYRNEEDYLKHLCLNGLAERMAFHSLALPEQRRVEERLKGELDVIIRRGLASYFLIVWDIVQFARKKQIPIGPGRGSAAGSLVTYLLGITSVNPMAYGLSFERFLNEDRFDLPDIDLDVCQIRRHEILQYIKDKYGASRVAHIGVVNTFGTRGAVREAGKQLQLPKEHVNVLAKLLPAFSGQGGLRHCLQTLPELQSLPADKEPYRSLFRAAECIEGLPRNHSAHPSGLLIGHEDLQRTIPLLQRPNGDRMTSYTKEDIRALGLLKIDLLGSRILSVIHETIQAIQERKGKTLDLQQIPEDDSETFRALCQGETLGCFQLESMGIRRLLRRMKPKHMEDLTSLLALYRPGAWGADLVESFLRKRRGQENIEVPLPALEPILAPTYGLILYQEQVMQIAHAVAGYSMGEADVLRRALSQKSASVLDDQRQRFIRGALKRGATKDQASAVFDFMARFIGYSFPKAHSVPYAYLSYWTVYLKTHYPKEYLASLLSMPGGYYDQRVYLREAAKMGIRLLHPDVNRSGFGFHAEEEGIRVGMDAIKGSGPEAVASLLHSRQTDGPFTSFQDLVSRMKAYRISGPVLKGWIASGACDGLGDTRRQMLAALDDSHFIFHQEASPFLPEFAESDKRRMEKRALGFWLDPVPSKKWAKFLQQYRIVPVEDLYRLSDRTRVRICGTVIQSRRQPSEYGNYVLSLVVQDHSGMIEVTLYPNTYKACLYELDPEGLMIEGIVRTDDGASHVVAEKIKALSSMYKKTNPARD